MLQHEEDVKNPNSNTTGLVKIPRVIPGGTCRTPVQVKVPTGQYELWMSLPSEERNEYLREAIALKLAEKNLISA